MFLIYQICAVVECICVHIYMYLHIVCAYSLIDNEFVKKNDKMYLKNFNSFFLIFQNPETILKSYIASNIDPTHNS